MKKGIYISLSCAILGVAALSGCSTTNKIPDATIENAIQDSTNIYSDYGLSIQQLSFDSRNYDKQEKTEAVTVTVNADNADPAYTATYDVLGKLSDKSWRIVSVTQTSEEVKPKAALTYEDVSLFSGELLQAAQGTSRFSDACTMHIQDCTIDSDTTSSSATASMVLEADTQYFNVKRDCLASFYYTLDGWILSNNSVGDYGIELNEPALLGTWSWASNGDYVTINITRIDGNSIYATYDDLAQFCGAVIHERHTGENFEFQLDTSDITASSFQGNDYYSEYYLTFAEANNDSNHYYGSFHIDPEDNAEDVPKLISNGNYLQKQ